MQVGNSLNIRGLVPFVSSQVSMAQDAAKQAYARISQGIMQGGEMLKDTAMRAQPPVIKGAEFISKQLGNAADLARPHVVAVMKSVADRAQTTASAAFTVMGQAAEVANRAAARYSKEGIEAIRDFAGPGVEKMQMAAAVAIQNLKTTFFAANPSSPSTVQKPQVQQAPARPAERPGLATPVDEPALLPLKPEPAARRPLPVIPVNRPTVAPLKLEPTTMRPLPAIPKPVNAEPALPIEAALLKSEQAAPPAMDAPAQREAPPPLAKSAATEPKAALEAGPGDKMLKGLPPPPPPPLEGRVVAMKKVPDRAPLAKTVSTAAKVDNLLEGIQGMKLKGVKKEISAKPAHPALMSGFDELHRKASALAQSAEDNLGTSGASEEEWKDSEAIEEKVKDTKVKDAPKLEEPASSTVAQPKASDTSAENQPSAPAGQSGDPIKNLVDDLKNRRRGIAGANDNSDDDEDYWN